jgi:hypothetical protein
MKNIISILFLALLMSCNSNTNSKTNSTPEDSVQKETIQKPPVETTAPTQLAKPKPVKVDSVFEGMYSYMADANMFVSCDKKNRMPVEMKGKYLDLERQYLRTVDGGVEVYVRLKGEVKKVPPMEGDKEIDALVITEVLELSKDKKCE